MLNCCLVIIIFIKTAITGYESCWNVVVLKQKREHRLRLLKFNERN